MTYRADPITQRDGSSLANSNCRMASIATGLDFHTLGERKSSGKSMRAAQDDQSGGTDSGDARQAWADGYGESLRVMDGHTFGDALADLRAGRLVHLDVWAATVGGVCLSGSGGYGHTIAVAPEHHSDGQHWLVADPWCSPPKWSWVLESKLRAGAERWGSEVYSAAALETDYPDDSSGPRDPRVLAIVARIVHRLMDRWRPGGAEAGLEAPDPGDTAGGAILYTTTRPQATEDVMGPGFSASSSVGVATVAIDGANLIATTDGRFIPVTKGYERNVAQLVTITDGRYEGEAAYLVSAGGGESALLLATHATYEANDPGDTDVVERRDAEWIDALTGGDPWPRIPG